MTDSSTQTRPWSEANRPSDLNLPILEMLDDNARAYVVNLASSGDAAPWDVAAEEVMEGAFGVDDPSSDVDVDDARNLILTQALAQCIEQYRRNQLG